MSQKPQIVYRNPKKTVRRDYLVDWATLNTTAYNVQVFVATDKCTIMGYDLRLKMISYEGTPAEDKRTNDWILYTADNEDVRVPPTDGTSGYLDAAVLDFGTLVIPDQAGIADEYHNKSRQKRKLAKGDQLKISFVGSDVDIKCWYFFQMIFYIGD